MSPCPCGTGKKYNECCGVFIQGQEKPSTPEALMRSRYVAYTEANVAYIGRTMKAPAKNSFDPKSAKKWAKRVKWLNLEVKASSIIQASKGFVEFIACFEEQGKIIKMHEFSEFHLENGEWYYVDGKNLR